MKRSQVEITAELWSRRGEARRYWDEGLSVEEIAERIGCGRESVRADVGIMGVPRDVMVARSREQNPPDTSRLSLQPIHRPSPHDDREALVRSLRICGEHWVYTYNGKVVRSFQTIAKARRSVFRLLAGEEIESRRVLRPVCGLRVCIRPTHIEQTSLGAVWWAAIGKASKQFAKEIEAYEKERVA